MASTAGTTSYQEHKDNLAKTKLAEQIRTVAIAMTAFRVQARVVPSFGANQGQAVAIEKYQKLSTNTTPIDEFSELPMKKPSINEVTVTIEEYGDGVAYTKKAKSISEYLLDEQLRRLVEMNVTETMDQVVGAVAQTADVFWTPEGTAAAPDGTYDTDGTVTATAARNLQAYDFKQIATNLKNNNVPKYDGSRYLAVMNPFASLALFNDGTDTAGYVETHKYDMPEQLIKGELGAFFGFRFVEETNVLGNVIPTGGTYNGEVIIFGDDAIAEALVQPEMIKVETWNFDRFIGIAWNTYCGFSKIWTHSTDGQHQMVRVWSA